MKIKIFREFITRHNDCTDIQEKINEFINDPHKIFITMDCTSVNTINDFNQKPMIFNQYVVYYEDIDYEETDDWKDLIKNAVETHEEVPFNE